MLNELAQRNRSVECRISSLSCTSALLPLQERLIRSSFDQCRTGREYLAMVMEWVSLDPHQLHSWRKTMERRRERHIRSWCTLVPPRCSPSSPLTSSFSNLTAQAETLRAVSIQNYNKHKNHRMEELCLVLFSTACS